MIAPAILFFRMRLISVPEKLTSQWRYPANLVNLAGVVFSESVNVKNLSMCSGGSSVTNAKPKYPLDASGGYNNYKILEKTNIFKIVILPSEEIFV